MTWFTTNRQILQRAVTEPLLYIIIITIIADIMQKWPKFEAQPWQAASFTLHNEYDNGNNMCIR